MARQKSWKGKKQYGVYKLESRVYENKVKKLERHCKNFPNDEEGKKNLERVKKEGYKGRQKPLNPGINKGHSYIVLGPVEHAETAGQQLSRLLGIPLKYAGPKRPAKVRHKKRRNVKS